MDNYVFIKPDEVFELFVEINQDLFIKNDVHMELVRKSQDYYEVLLTHDENMLLYYCILGMLINCSLYIFLSHSFFPLP